MESASSNAVSGNFEANFYDPEAKCELVRESTSGLAKPTKIKFSVKNSTKFDLTVTDVHSIGEDVITKKLLEDIGVENSYSHNDRAAIYLNQIKHSWEGRIQLEQLEASYSEMEAKQDGTFKKSSGFAFSIFPVIHGNPGKKGGSASATSTPLSTERW